jgi:uncharacterized RDD family membrane protein YckC
MASRPDVVPLPADVEAEADETAPDEILTGEAVALDLRPAGFALRAGGAAIDMIVYFGATYLILTGISLLLLHAQVEDAVYAIVFTVTFVTGLVAAPIAVETATRGRSVGKLAVGARVVRDDGGAIGFRHALIRGLAGVLEIWSTLGGLAIVMGLLSPRSKRLGDLMAGTFAQYERVSRRGAPPVILPWELGAWATVADVARLPEGLARRVAQFLREAGEYEPARRAGLAASLANETAPYVSPLPAVPPEVMLAAVIAVRREREARALLTEQRRLEALAPVLDGLPYAYPSRAAGQVSGSESRSSS